jgi:lysophospholipase L1-like esterase
MPSVMRIVAGSHVHFVGDSITAISWFNGQYGGGTYASAPNSFIDRIQSATQALPAVARPSSNSGAAAKIVGAGVAASVLPSKPGLFTVTASGVSGNKAADILSDGIPARITNFNPDVVVLEIGVNDAGGGTNPATFQTQYASIVSQVLAWKSTTQILCMGIACYYEQWQAGPAWGPNIFDSAIDTGINPAIQAVVTANLANCTYVDLRTPCLAAEVTFNSPAPGITDGIVCNGAPHPSTYLTPTAAGSGMVLWGGWTFPYVNVVAP